jgi:hypothetical protein
MATTIAVRGEINQRHRGVAICFRSRFRRGMRFLFVMARILVGPDRRLKKRAGSQGQVVWGMGFTSTEKDCVSLWFSPQRFEHVLVPDGPVVPALFMREHRAHNSEAACGETCGFAAPFSQAI